MKHNIILTDVIFTTTYYFNISVQIAAEDAEFI